MFRTDVSTMVRPRQAGQKGIPLALAEDQREFAELLVRLGIDFKPHLPRQLVLCPWHGGHTPSLSLDLRWCVFHCHSTVCGVHGGLSALRFWVKGGYAEEGSLRGQYWLDPPEAETDRSRHERESSAGRFAPRPAISAVGEWDRERDAAVRRGLQRLAGAGREDEDEFDTEHWPRARQMVQDALEGAERCNRRAYYQEHESDCGGKVYLPKLGAPCHGFAHERCVVSRVRGFKRGKKDGNQDLRSHEFVFPTCVGVNRQPAYPRLEETRIPHVRGGEPAKD